MNYLARLQKLRQEFTCEALLIDHPIQLLYLTGIEMSAGKLLISADACDLIVDGRYFEKCQKHSPFPVSLLDDMPLSKWLQNHQVGSLGFDTETTIYQSYLNLKKIADEQKTTLIPLEGPVQKLRLIKDEDEITILREAAKLGNEGYNFVVNQLHEGVQETMLAMELEFFWRRRGARKVAFDPIIAFGANSSMPHYRAGDARLKNGMPVLLDIGVTWKHYHSDMTRVVFFGEPSPKIKEIYAIVEKAKQAAMDLCHPGTLVGELDKVAREIISSYGYGQYFTHSLGHGLGLDVHEPPTIRSKGAYSEMPLQAGMVITIEPGIYLPNEGGVRLEDTLLITSDGYENLTQPKNN